MDQRTVVWLVALRKRQKAKLEVTELKMLSFSLGSTRTDGIRNEDFRDEMMRYTVLEMNQERPD